MAVSFVLASLVPAIVLATLWPFSYRWHERAGVGTGPHFFGFDSFGGQVRLVWMSARGPVHWWTSYQRMYESPGSVRRLEFDHHALGFGYTFDAERRFPHTSTTAGIRAVGLPYWFAILTMLAVPARALALVRANRRSARRERAGLCRWCGYDLRASGERCPECGGEVAPADSGLTPAALRAA